MNFDFVGEIAQKEKEDFALKQQTEDEVNNQSVAEDEVYASYKGFPDGVFVTHSRNETICLEKTLRAPMPQNYKKIPYFINDELYAELQQQPCSINKSIPFLLEFAVAELKRQKKQLVVDLPRPETKPRKKKEG
jgi:hypothetical protein